MTDRPQPQSDSAALVRSLAAWHERWRGRSLFRAVAGEDWLRLHLEGEERPAIVLTRQPGAALVLAGRGPLPEALHRDLAPVPRHPLPGLLQGCSLERIGMLDGDRVVAIILVGPGGRRALLHQLFGPRGNTALLDERHKLLWAGQRPPHPLLTQWPRQWAEAAGADADTALPGDGFPLDELSAAALERWIGARLELRVRSLSARLGRREASTARLVENLDGDLQRAERGDEFRRRAETLAVHLHVIRAGADRVVLTDPRDGASLEIELDPALSASANLEAWFRRARKADKGRDVIAERLEQARELAERLRAARETLESGLAPGTEAIERLAHIREWEQQQAGLLPAPDRKATRRGSPEEPARPFRRYRIDGRWDVWIGRSNRENDELTFGASHGQDLWLHAQGVPGSHVILRTAGKPEQVPRDVLEKAARLAALHCRARHSQLVPVIWTERRYVRKPRKAPPGAATCLREKSLFVEPGIADGVEPA